MKLLLKPNANSRSAGRVGKTLTYNMVDICDEKGNAWAITMIDLFHETEDPEWRQQVYEPLLRGSEITVQLIVGWEDEKETPHAD